MSKRKSIEKRKSDHLELATWGKMQVGDNGFGGYKFIHNALPEIDFNEIDISLDFLNKKVDYPFFISCMTGGVFEAKGINRNLAKAAQKYNIAMGVGSQRMAIEQPELEKLFKIRGLASDIPLLANIGIVQLNYGFGLNEFQKCADMINADALVIHLNPIQEIIQPEGNRNWKRLLKKLSKIIDKLSVPVIVKEVGFGLSEDVIRRLYDVGVRYFDTAGWGGTNWALAEGFRKKADKGLGKLFSQWGIPTAESIIMCKKFKSNFKDKEKRDEIVILGSGGIRNGIDIAKAICLGADMVGIASPFARAAMESSSEIERLIEKYAMELKTAMFGVGASDIKQLKRAQLVKNS